jgi:hypothetical protein
LRGADCCAPMHAQARAVHFSKMVYRGGCVVEYAEYLERSPSTYDEQIGLTPRSEEADISAADVPPAVLDLVRGRCESLRKDDRSQPPWTTTPVGACSRYAVRLLVPLWRIQRAPVRRVLERNAAVSLLGVKPAIGFAASAFAVWCQVLLLATISLSPLAIGAAPIGNIPICHTDGGSEPARQTPGQPPHDCALCVVCLAHASPPAILPPTPTLPDRRPIAVVRLDAAHPRAPPVQLIAAAQPRGPPSLI